MLFIFILFIPYVIDNFFFNSYTYLLKFMNTKCENFLVVCVELYKFIENYIKDNNKLYVLFYVFYGHF